MKQDKTAKSPVTFIMICCCTFKRPEKLKRLLNNLCTINYPENIRTEILIADNDKEKSAQKTTEGFKDVLPVHYTTEFKQGLSNIRNKAIKEAISLGASHIAFIDDDEIADTNWLINHVEFYNRFEDVYISSGPTYKKFENDYPDYIINNQIFNTVSSKKLGAYKETCASGNVFFPLNIIKENQIYFSADFNFSGSEDTDFFSRLKEFGYNIGWNCNAVNYELINDERANIKWILTRAFHNGYSVALSKFLNKRNCFKRGFYVIKKLMTLTGNIVAIIFSLPLGMTKLLNSVTRFTKNLGKLAGVIILKHNTYYGDYNA